MLAKVTAVRDFDCDLEDDEGLKYPKVRLRPVLNGKQALTLQPKVGTYVLAARIENDNDWQVIGVDESQKFSLKIGDNNLVIDESLFSLNNQSGKFELDAQGFVMEKGSSSLKSILEDIISAVEVIVTNGGTNPNYVKLTQASTKLNVLLK